MTAQTEVVEKRQRGWDKIVPRVAFACQVCGREKFVLPSYRRRVSGKFCSYRCAGLATLKPDRHAEIACTRCGTLFLKRTDHVSERNYCSRKCFAEHRAATPSRWGKNKIPGAAKEYHRAYAANNRARVNELSRRNGKKNRPSRNALQQRRRAGGDLKPAQWRAVLGRYGGKCAKCGSKNEIQMDHIVPVALGGLTLETNVQPLCRKCNQAKGKRREVLL